MAMSINRTHAVAGTSGIAASCRQFLVFVLASAFCSASSTVFSPPKPDAATKAATDATSATSPAKPTTDLLKPTQKSRNVIEMGSERLIIKVDPKAAAMRTNAKSAPVVPAAQIIDPCIIKPTLPNCPKL